MNKLLIAGLLAFICVQSTHAQTSKQVNWTYTVNQINKEEAELVFTADIEKDWHIYSQFTPDGGPLPTVFTFEPSKSYELVGKVIEPKTHEEYDSVFQVKVLTLDGKPIFRQKIKLKEPSFTVSGQIDGQVCKEVCMMFGDRFSFKVGEVKN
jgi:thiol:disulfide interchange protein DsbD